MPYVRVRKKIRIPVHHHLVRNLRIFLAICTLSIAAGFLATVIGNKAHETRSLSLETVAAQQKQKIIDGYKEKYGDNWKEKALEDYKKYKRGSW